ncbi:type VII secretion protein EssB [Jeotgalibacillus sp. S-D1]|uniref:type VII secretion protein EssB n=1 Tax=Jeotgalibacillus sp. S-D1 TaxID=2552189 RepID=UPI00105A1921|nr:type VII secretion protein EssB [Jeotgalibacillus sp. S-D1]TDL31371.1 type VII secretion protein EssB [Jeotgalibacillus sp. S-D1]
MKEHKLTYLEERLDAKADHTNGHVFTFQQTKIKLVDEVEIHLLKTVHPELKKEIHTTEDEVVISVIPPESFQPFTAMHKKSRLARWTFALKLVHFSERKLSKRLHPIYSPDNIIIDRSNSPYLLHYGVEESLPPYEREEELSFNELKASILYAIDSSKPFKDYLHVHHTLQLTPAMQEIREAADAEVLKNLLIAQIDEEEKRQKTFTNVPNKAWKVRKYILIGLTALLIPLLILSFYSYFFIQPRQEAYINSNEHFLKNQYSNVVNELSDHNPDRMPYVVQYQLARAYIVVMDVLKDEQRAAVEDRITLQTDPQYFLFWINLGRGENEDAINIARSLQERDLIMMGLLQYSEEIKADDDLTGEEKQQELDKINQELEEYDREQKEQQELEEAEEAEDGEGNTQDAETEAESKAKPKEETKKPADKKDEQASSETSADKTQNGVA